MRRALESTVERLTTAEPYPYGYIFSKEGIQEVMSTFQA